MVWYPFDGFRDIYVPNFLKSPPKTTLLLTNGYYVFFVKNNCIPFISVIHSSLKPLNLVYIDFAQLLIPMPPRQRKVVEETPAPAEETPGPASEDVEEEEEEEEEEVGEVAEEEFEYTIRINQNNIPHPTKIFM
jgi:hypothetical protein